MTGGISFLVSLFLLMAPSMARADVNSGNTAIEAGVTGRLYHAGVYKHGTVKVSVESGVATLTGTVDSYGEAQRAAREASRQPGVQKVVNRIQVNTAGVTSQQLLAKARHDVLVYPFYTIFDHISLRAEGNRLTIEGQVTQPYKKADLGHILAGIRGVAHLRNNLEVLPPSQMDDHIREEIAERIYGDPLFVNYANQVNPPIHIIVNRGDVTLYGAVGTNLERAKAGIDARLSTLFLGFKNKLRVVS